MSVVEYFGENPKTTQPSMFFPFFVRFIKAYKVRDLPSTLFILTLYFYIHTRHTYSKHITKSFDHVYGKGIACVIEY